MAEEMPPWLNSGFLETVLQEGDETRKVHINNFSAKLALPPGNNYTSHIFRVKVSYSVDKGSVKDISLMVKAPITEGFVNKIDMFTAEPLVYQELLPRFKNKINCDFGPKSFPCPMTGLVLKDLKEDGFTTQDRLKQLDFSHCKIVLTSIAKFHAASVACFHDDTDFVKSLCKERLYIDSPFLDDMKFWFKSAAGTVASKIRELEGCKPTADFFVERAASLADSVANICKAREGSLNVINHGDLWSNNMLFKHDTSGKVVDVKFIDFQVVRYTSPALDVLFLLYTSADEDARSRQRELLNVYLQTLNSSLENLGCEERLTSAQFDQEIKNCMDWVVVMIVHVLAIVLCDPNDMQNTEELSQEGHTVEHAFDNFTAAFKSKRYNEELPKVVKLFQQQLLS